MTYEEIAAETAKQRQQLVDELVAFYKPQNVAARAAVNDIAFARWQMGILQSCVVAQWQADPGAIAENPTLVKLNREITRLQQFIARAERQIKFVNANFGKPAPATKKKPGRDVNDPDPRTLADLPEPIYTVECTPRVISVYRRAFPEHPIIIMPPRDQPPAETPWNTKE